MTLVSEILPARLRGYGTMIVASVGVSGAVVGNLVAKTLDWRWAYFVGGGLGLVLLVLRISVHESGMFAPREAPARRRRARRLPRPSSRRRDRLARYLASILIAVPIWFANAILVPGSPEFAQALGVTGPVRAGDAVPLFYGGLVLGDLASGLLSQALQSRRRVVLLFISLLAAAIVGLLPRRPGRVAGAVFLALCGLLGYAGGYWAIFVTVAAEQFGTNIRATVATTVPNFVRGLVVAVNLMFVWYPHPRSGSSAPPRRWGSSGSRSRSGPPLRLRETFGIDLDYVEPD